ncbi:MAG: O-acetyl-ADP-ribose deacetylase [Desulfobacterales bacterium]|jgi:O-acetyl-ADP-ribose deacetylase|nr:O-acetyl-ADP-ribose deacetylase [Desulfobacteraceae bacterium]MBT4364388.1 O-acetyl-ADP-ribose deacetylase [Desulfobacteraceae bacterium]MBT7086384.1 O-acetyl-ADP-ribose deacetylase [Desulfobacterales bacterium]MBT7696251.1 O-acetyl-ADP-ribose deacetylase [Desulfobacterales bacterium]
MTINIKQKTLNRMEVIQGDITRLDVDIIVNAANTSLLGGGGVDGSIHRAAGPELLVECKTIGGCPTGEAKITKGYNLAAKHIIHTVGPVYSGEPKDKILLSSCYINSLNLAIGYDISSIAFPAISCGVYGYPIREASKIAIEATARFLENKSRIKRVVFVLFSKEDYYIYANHLK